MKKTFFTVETEEGKVLNFVNKAKAENFGKPIPSKVEQGVFDAMLKDGAFDDCVPDAVIIEEITNQPETPQIEPNQSAPVVQIPTTIDEETRAILESLQNQLEELKAQNEQLKNRPSFQKLIEINERKDTVKNHIQRFGEGKIKLDNIRKQLNNYQELDEVDYISLVFVSISRTSGEVKEVCRISNVATLQAITGEAVSQIETRIDKLETEKEELEKYL